MKLFALILILTTTSLIAQPQLVEIKKENYLFDFDIHYATTNNFLNQVLYECDRCYLLPEVAEALTNAAYYFCDLGYTIKIFDCYRPLSVQKKMWAIFPNRIYVANPAFGSMHNRGAAVDITLINNNTCEELDMGSAYDFFGRASHTDNYNFSEAILNNRKLLFEGMKKFGFSLTQSEWWHFNYNKKRSSPVLDIPFDCEN